MKLQDPKEKLEDRDTFDHIHNVRPLHFNPLQRKWQVASPLQLAQIANVNSVKKPGTLKHQIAITVFVGHIVHRLQPCKLNTGLRRQKH